MDITLETREVGPWAVTVNGRKVAEFASKRLAELHPAVRKGAAVQGRKVTVASF